MKSLAALIIGSLLIASYVSAEIPNLTPEPGYPELLAAREAFAARNNAEAMRQLKQCLEKAETGYIVQRRALQLLERFYERSPDGDFPLDFTLPAQLTNLRVQFSAGYRSRVRDQSLELSILCPGASCPIAESVRIFRDFVLSREVAGQLVFDNVHEELPPGPGFRRDLSGPLVYSAPLRMSSSRREAVEANWDGLYKLELKLRGDARIRQAWFMVNEARATAIPKFETLDEAEFTTARPTFAWKNFFSPEFKSYEKRSMRLGLIGYEFLLNDPRIESHTVTRNVVNGDVVLGLDFFETKKFGPLQIVRASGVSRHVIIDANPS